MNLSFKLISAVFTLFLLGGCASSTQDLSDSSAIEKNKSILELKLLLQEADNSGVKYLAPEGLEVATEIYNESLEKAKAQDPDANSLAESGVYRLRDALKSADSSRTILREVLSSRKKAIVAKADILYVDEYQDLEDTLKDASVYIEKGKESKAKKLRSELIKGYSTLELKSLKTDLSKKAKETLAQAKKRDAFNYAPKTIKLAQDELELCVHVINAGRTQIAKAKHHADRSIYYANKAIQITETSKSFERRDFSSEDIILWHQKQLNTINSPFGKKLKLDKSSYDVVVTMKNKIKAVLAQSNEVSQADKKLLKAKAANKKAKERYAKIRKMFTKKEAYVYRQVNNVLLETHAFNFNIGGSEISSNNFELLEKILAAIKLFDNPNIIVKGHTDSSGSARQNMNLSQLRANTVAKFLIKVGKINRKKVKSKGYGESRPIANNESKAGRKRNRRIEILIIN